MLVNAKQAALIVGCSHRTIRNWKWVHGWLRAEKVDGALRIDTDELVRVARERGYTPVVPASLPVDVPVAAPVDIPSDFDRRLAAVERRLWVIENAVFGLRSAMLTAERSVGPAAEPGTTPAAAVPQAREQESSSALITRWQIHSDRWWEADRSPIRLHARASLRAHA